MDLLAVVLACSLYPDDALVQAIAQSNSRGNPFAVSDASLEAPPLDGLAAPSSLVEATARVRDIAAHGGRPVVGLMQLPLPWVEAFGRRLEEAFEPCMNIALGSAMMDEFDRECSEAKTPKGPPTRRRSCMAHRYAEALGMPEFERVLELELRFQTTIDVSRHTVGAAILVPGPAEGPWGADRILVSTRESPSP
jgi:hypothetical protein